MLIREETPATKNQKSASWYLRWICEVIIFSRTKCSHEKLKHIKLQGSLPVANSDFLRNWYFYQGEFRLNKLVYKKCYVYIFSVLHKMQPQHKPPRWWKLLKFQLTLHWPVIIILMENFHWVCKFLKQKSEPFVGVTEPWELLLSWWNFNPFLGKRTPFVGGF